MIDTPQVVNTDEQLTAVIHLTIPRAEIINVMGPAIAEVTEEGLSVQDRLECYTTGPESSPDPDKWRTELNRPLTA